VESTTADAVPPGSEIGGLKPGRIYFINTSVALNPPAPSPAAIPISFYETPDFSISKLSALSDSGIRLTLPNAGVGAVRHVFKEVFTIDGGDGDDRITAAYDALNDPLSAGKTRANYLVGSAGNDRITGGLDADYIDAGAGDDFVVADAKPPVSRSTPTVPSWIDTVRGGAGADTIVGGAGADTLRGGAGADSMTGGQAGINTYDYTNFTDSLIGSFDTITDFKTTDKIKLAHAVATGNFKFATAADSGNLATDLSTALTATNFIASGATLVSLGTGAGAPKYLVLNDATAAFNSSTDAVIKIVGSVVTASNLTT
jgi:Ca2+-binding RTX toxin-like protein